MCHWVRAMNKYHFVAKEVEPKRKALKKAQEELDELTQSLNKLRDRLKEVEDNILDLESKFSESTIKKEELAAKARSSLLMNRTHISVVEILSIPLVLIFVRHREQRHGSWVEL